MKREAGFTLIELLITLLLMGLVMTAATDMFVGMMRSYKQQGKVTETNVEGIISLEMLRRDIESAGYGLPWTITTAAYTGDEATNATAAAYSDSPTNSPPRAILIDLNADGSAYLVIKAMNLARNAACSKWAILSPTGVVSPWLSPNVESENLLDTDRVVLISPGSSKTTGRILVNSGIYSAIKTQFVPDETRIIYGVDDSALRMPFNRADYYLSTTVALPARCAPGTKVLVKSVVNQSDGGFSGANTFPLLDCVADMQVVAFLDTDNDGAGDDSSDFLLAADAETIRNRVKEIRVYILAQEGQRDPGYIHAPAVIQVGESAVIGRNFDLSSLVPGSLDWQNYRWKIHTLVVRPKSLR
jgi:prepilin-type N-terminal cleavage/methylation domain-containing protein